MNDIEEKRKCIKVLEALGFHVSLSTNFGGAYYGISRLGPSGKRNHYTVTYDDLSLLWVIGAIRKEEF